MGLMESESIPVVGEGGVVGGGLRGVEGEVGWWLDGMR